MPRRRLDKPADKRDAKAIAFRVNAAERDGHQAGWSECLDALADQLHALATQEKSR